MKSTISTKNNLESKSYPYLGIYKDIFIVLFTGPKIGTVVYSKNYNKFWPLGFYSETWDMNSFEYFKGEVILSNEN